jgi:hypothetical protein
MLTPWRSKWFAWQPAGEIISVSPETELTKLTKLNSVSSGSSTFGKTPINGPDVRDSGSPSWEHLTTPEALSEAAVERHGLGFWLIGRCAFDESFETSMGSLFLDFCRWRVEADLPLASRASFALDIKDARYQMKDGFVIGLALKEDYLAQQ